MLRIQVLGSGLIPRGHGIAPKKEPFPADLKLIGLIISTAGLKVNFVHPESGNLVSLTRDNYQAMYKKYAHKIYKKPEVAKVEEPKTDGAPLNPENPNTGENHGGPVIPTPAPVVTTPVVPVTPAPVVPPVVAPVEADKAPEVPAEKKEESAEFTMKPIVSPEENKNKGNQNNNNNNRGQNNNNRK